MSKLDEIKVDYWEETDLNGQRTVLTCQEVDYHRNGISGIGFHIVKFHDKANGPMVGILFSSPANNWGALKENNTGYCAVFNRDRLKDDDYRFMYNSWRGDVFEPFLRRCIAEYDKEFDKVLKGSPNA